MNLRIPDAEEEGWVTVKVNGKSDRTGKSSWADRNMLFQWTQRASQANSPGQRAASHLLRNMENCL